MTKMIPTIMAVLVSVLGTLAPQITQFISDHPNVALYAAAIGTIAAHFTQSPAKTPTKAKK